MPSFVIDLNDSEVMEINNLVGIASDLNFYTSKEHKSLKMH